MPIPLRDGEVRVLAPRWYELLVRTVDFVAPPPPIMPLHRPENLAVPCPLVDLCSTGGGARH